jgi:hypothetical protein
MEKKKKSVPMEKEPLKSKHFPTKQASLPFFARHLHMFLALPIRLWLKFPDEINSIGR